MEQTGLCDMNTHGFNVGCRTADVYDAVQGAAIPIKLLYPTKAPEGTVRFGSYEISVALNAPVANGRFPLVVVSHGGGGSSLTYRDLASSLVRAGYVVALPEHPGNNRLDNSLEGTTENLENRPRHVSLVVDAAFADDAVGDSLLRDHVAVVGHSMGGYTALAVAGGRPDTGPVETRDGNPRRIIVSPDRRVRALVLLAPACGWFWSEGALADVDVPILLFTAEKDEHAHHLHVNLIERSVRDPRQVDHRIVPNAGHHAFQTPFPAAMSGPHFAPSRDPIGFERAAFQPMQRFGLF